MKANKVLSILLTAAMLLAVLPLGVWAEGIDSDAAHKKAYSLIPNENYIWTKMDVGDATVEIVYQADGTVTFTDTGSAFPSAEAVYMDIPIAANIEEDYLSIDFSIENGSAHIFIYLMAAYGSGYYVYTLSNSALGATDYMESIGDLYDGVYKLDMSLADFVASTRLSDGSAFPQEAIIDGQLRFVGLQIYVCNGGTLTVRDLSVVTSETEPSEDDSSNENASDELPEDEEFSDEESSEELPEGEEKLEVFEIGDWLVSFDNGEAILVNYIGGDRHVTIPSFIEGCPVTTIGYCAFLECYDVESVSIPNTVKTIENSAFSECSAREIILPDSVTYIGNEAFSSCPLMSIWIPASVEYIGRNAFSFCHTNVYCEANSQPQTWNADWIHDGTYFEFEDFFVTVHWGAKYFKSETSGFSYGVSNGEATITYYAGVGGDIIISSEINGYPVTGIGYDAFRDSWLKSVVIPTGITNIGKNAFFNRTALTNITIPDGVTIIGANALYGCISLTDIAIPDSVTTVGNNVFEFCYDLSDIYCEAESQPADWDENWLGNCGATVHWGTDVETETITGDITGDGKINGADVSHLMRYFADVDYATGTSSVEIGDGADCNGDGIVDGRDVVRLLRYLANRDPLTGESDVELG